jgi:hypothetical protein
VRILLDEQLPRQLAPYLVGHDVRTVQQESWAGLKNGELLTNALEDLRPLVPAALTAIEGVQPGQVVRVEA